jgi:hypothetical protein
MQGYDAGQFAANLKAVFEAFGARPPTEAGLDVWFRTLEDFPLGAITQQLDVWPKRSNKAPTPRDIWQACKDAAAARVDEEAERHRQDEQNAPWTMGATPAGREALKRMRSAVAGMRAAPSAGKRLDWAERIVDRFVDGDDSLPNVSFRLACDALGKTSEDVEQLREIRANGKRLAA